MTKSRGIYCRRGASNDERFDGMIRFDDRGCHIWLGKKARWGHGHFNLRLPNGKFKTVIAHRWAYKRQYGEVADGEVICHSCDVPSCVNPAHLYHGSHATNVGDMRRAGTHISVRPELHRGEGNGHSKLTEDQINEIREAAQGGCRASSLARLYAVDYSTIRRIIRGNAWTHVK